MASEHKPKRNIWIGYMVAGSVITSPGATLITTGVQNWFRYPSLLLVFPLIHMLAIVAGMILVLIGVVLIIRGYQLYKREKEWDERMGVAPKAEEPPHRAVKERADKPPFRKNIWIPLYAIGGILTISGASVLGLGIFLYWLFSPFISFWFTFPPIYWLIFGPIIGGVIVLIVGIVLLLYGRRCRKREQEWDQQMR